MKKLTKSNIKKAIKGSGGIISTIAKRLEVAWATAQTHINKYPETKSAYNDEVESILDLAESTIYKSIKEGDTQDAKWLLSKRGKKRGYSDKVDIDGTMKIQWVEEKTYEANEEADEGA